MMNSLTVFKAVILSVFLSVFLTSCGGGGGGGGGTSGDKKPPTVLSTSPAINAIGVAVNTPITVTFSEKMDASTINAATVYMDIVTGTVTYSDSDHTATFRPLRFLNANTTYKVTITTGVKDRAGNSMAADYVWSFTTSDKGVSGALSAMLIDDCKLGVPYSKAHGTITFEGSPCGLPNNINVDGVLLVDGTFKIFKEQEVELYASSYSSTSMSGSYSISYQACFDIGIFSMQKVSGGNDICGGGTGNWSGNFESKPY